MTHLLGTRRKFDGKYYRAWKSFKRKSDATARARKARKMGVPARVVKANYNGKKEYYLYLRQ